VPKLTKTVVESAEPRTKQYSIWCSDLKGFGALINPTGKRTYVVDYRTSDGARRRMSIGVHGQITTEQARKLALEALGGIVIQKTDPLEERRTRRQAMTVAELCDAYIVSMAKGLILGRGGRPKKPSTVEIDIGRIRRHIIPLLGRKRVIDLVTTDVTKFLKDVTVGKTALVERTGKKRGKAVVEGGAGTAARTAGLLGGILSFAMVEGIITMNPATGVKRPADKRRQRRLSPDENRALGKALAAAEAEGDTEQGIAGIRLLALTGCRLGEIVGLRWSEVDEDGQCLRLADTKTGASVRPVGHAVFDVLAGLTRREGSDHVLPAVRGDGAFGGMPRAWDRVMARAGLTDVTPHTLRHSFASVAGDLGFAESTIAALLGHAGNSVTSRYVHRLDSVLVASANRVASEVRRQMTGEAAAVVNLPRRA
jgi:integrase